MSIQSMKYIKILAIRFTNLNFLKIMKLFFHLECFGKQKGSKDLEVVIPSLIKGLSKLSMTRRTYESIWF